MRGGPAELVGVGLERLRRAQTPGPSLPALARSLARWCHLASLALLEPVPQASAELPRQPTAAVEDSPEAQHRAVAGLVRAVDPAPAAGVARARHQSHLLACAAALLCLTWRHAGEAGSFKPYALPITEEANRGQGLRVYWLRALVRRILEQSKALLGLKGKESAPSVPSEL